MPEAEGWAGEEDREGTLSMGVGHSTQLPQPPLKGCSLPASDTTPPFQPPLFTRPLGHHTLGMSFLFLYPLLLLQSLPSVFDFELKHFLPFLSPFPPLLFYFIFLLLFSLFFISLFSSYSFYLSFLLFPSLSLYSSFSLFPGKYLPQCSLNYPSVHPVQSSKSICHTPHFRPHFQ